MHIETTGEPVAHRPYHMPLTKRKSVDDTIDQLLNEDIIVPVSSPWASPMTLVPKKDGDFHLCTDLHRLNAQTVKNKYPLPVMGDLFNQLVGQKYLVQLM